MPVKIRKLKSGKFRVYNGGKVVAKSTTKEKAEKQSRLLRGIEHGMVLKKKKHK
jgi:hypothetical protein